MTHSVLFAMNEALKRDAILFYHQTVHIMCTSFHTYLITMPEKLVDSFKFSSFS